MSTSEFQTLLQFFKALANENRLKIMGILANGEYGVEELATLLDLKAPTVSHHLQALKGLGLIDMRLNGNDHLYRLNPESVQTMSKEVLSSLSSEKMGALVDDVEYAAWERKVLNNFLDEEKIVTVPTGYKKRLVLLKWLANHFEDDVQYKEEEVNEIIERHYHDYCLLRRELIMHRFMKRDNGMYWKIEWHMPELNG